MKNKVVSLAIVSALLFSFAIPSFAVDSDLSLTSTTLPTKSGLFMTYNGSVVASTDIVSGQNSSLIIKNFTGSYSYIPPSPSSSLDTAYLSKNSIYFNNTNTYKYDYLTGSYYCYVHIPDNLLSVKYVISCVDFNGKIIYYYFGPQDVAPLGTVYAGPLSYYNNIYSITFSFNFSTNSDVTFKQTFFVLDSYNLSNYSSTISCYFIYDFADNSSSSILDILLSGNFSELLPALREIISSIGDHIGQAVDSILDAIKSAFGSGGSGSGSGNSLAQNIQDIRDTVADETDKSINQGNEALKQSLLDDFTSGGSNTTNQNGTSAAVTSGQVDDLSGLSQDMQEVFKSSGSISDTFSELNSEENFDFLSPETQLQLNPGGVSSVSLDDDGYIDFYALRKKGVDLW